MPTDPVAELRAAVEAAAEALSGKGLGELGLERPPKAQFGDYSTNAAMLLSPVMGEPPRGVAEKLGGVLAQDLASVIERVEVAGPGFLNLFVSDGWLRSALGAMVAGGEDYGRGQEGLRIHLEFVSANPTGPVTVAGARHAAYGDSLARILEFAGNNVEREYYVNDAGSQILRFGESLHARARGEEPPEGGYLGGYVTALAERIPSAAEADPAELARCGVELMLEDIRATLERFSVHFDSFFSERTLHDGDRLERSLAKLDATYESDGATWMRTTALGDDKDRVLRRSSGELTYFASDVAYHDDKIQRGYDRAINVLGADHHGYTKRLQAVWRSLGGREEAFETPLMQLVNLMEGGHRVQMSKRAGAIETLDDLLDDIGVDAARYFLLQRSHDTTIDIDLELAREQSQDNPVYYLQYAHARIASILRKAGKEPVAAALASDPAGSTDPLHPSSRALLKRLLEWPEEIAEAAERRAPHRLTTYLHELAQDFSAFYRDVRVVGAAEEGGDEACRLAMCVATKRVLAGGLDLLGVGAPEEMRSGTTRP